MIGFMENNKDDDDDAMKFDDHRVMHHVYFYSKTN